MVKGKLTKRKSWKKAKIEDVEEALEDERLVNKIRNKATKGKASQPEHELFTIDTAGSGQGLPAKTRREIARAKIFPPKAPRLPLSGSEKALVERMGDKMEAARKKAPLKKAKEVFNVWEGKTKEEVLKELRKDWAGVRRVPQERPLSKPKYMHKTIGPQPAVIPGHEGQSINPPEEAYKEVAFRAAAAQLEEERKREELERQFAPMTLAVRDAIGDAVDEMDEEAKVQMFRSISCARSAEKEGIGGAESRSAPPVVRSNKPKSEAKRRRELRRKILDEREQKRLKQRKLEKSVGEVGRYLKEMKQEEEEHRQRAQYREAVRAKRKELQRTEGAVGKCRRIGLGRFKDPFIAVPEEEGTGSLRGMSVKGCAFQDRYLSFVGRGLLNPQIDRSWVQPHKKLKKAPRRPVIFAKDDGGIFK